MAVYGEFDLRYLNVKPEDIDKILSGEFYEEEILSKGTKIIKSLYNYKTGILILDQFLKKVNINHNIVIISNFIYVDAPDNQKDTEIENIINQICNLYENKLKSKEMLKTLLKLYFLYYLDKNFKDMNGLNSLQKLFNENKPKNYKLKSIPFYNSAYWPKQSIKKEEDITKKSGSTEFNEFLNFIYFYYKIKQYDSIQNMSFINYLLGLFDLHGYSKEIPSKVSLNPPIEISSGFNFKKATNDFKANLLPLLCQYKGKQEYSYLKSARLTYENIEKTRLFSNKEYEFFSENSNTYRKIFENIRNDIRSSYIFDTYFKTLNINKFFISDFLAIEKTEINEILTTINTLRNNFNKNPSITELSIIFNYMDNMFLQKKFIPISLKMLESYWGGKKSLPANTVTKEEVASNIVKIINSPRINKNQLKNYKNINLDDFDLLLIELIERMKSKNDFDKEFEKILKIDKDTFKYSMDISTISYGGSSYNSKYNIYFEFDLFLSNKERKTYTFEMINNIKIRTKGTASGTGEGSINSYSLNYVIRNIYKGGYSSELSKISNNRSKNSPKTNSTEKKYFGVMRSHKLLTPSSDNDTNVKKLETVLFSEEGTKCKQHFVSYYNSLFKKNEDKINESNLKNNKSLKIYLGKICGKELGMLLDENIEVDPFAEKIKINLPESKKNKIIASAWGLIAARGPIEFNEKTFKNVQELQDVTKYQIKFPALVKIGI